MKRVTVTILAVLLSGCALTRSIDNAVDAYCELNDTSRTINRGVVAVAIYPNRVEIECGGLD